jgi:heavy metal sensor kinase
MKIRDRFRSVRSILTLWYSAVLLAAFVVFAIAAHLYLRSVLLASLEQNLLDEVDWIARLVEVDRMRFRGTDALEGLSSDIERRILEHFTGAQRNYVVVLATTTGRVLYRSGAPTDVPLVPGGGGAPDRPRVHRLEDTRSGTLRVASRRADPFVITVGYTERSIDSVLDHFLSVVAILVPIALLISLGGGYFMAGIALKPVHDIAQMTDRITAERLDLRIPGRPVEDELGVLIRTINTMIARLQLSFGQIREFSMGVAHELKTPLTIMKGEAELALSHPGTSPDAQRLAALTMEETARMSKIVDDLLTLARGDAGQITIERGSVPMDGIIGEIHEDALILATERGLHVDLLRNDPGVVRGDPARLRQLFRVLMTNAVQYTDPGGSIRLQSAPDGDAWMVRVEDTGIGIPPESIDRIFDRFYRGDQARSRMGGGTGLGLAIAKWIVEAHHGRITVTSTPGKGSSFSVRLPRT